MNAILSYVNDSDFRVSHRLTEWCPPRWFRVWMLTATRLGDGWLWLALGVVLLASGGRGHDVFGAAALAALVANVALVFLKKRFRRRRPCEYERAPWFPAKYTAQFAADVFSFPSGHALNAFAIGSVVALAFPLAAAPAFLVAASVAASRVFLGLHFVTDVLAGALMGTLIGLLAVCLLLGWA
jgi:undecaprenyl-diphosphatase